MHYPFTSGWRKNISIKKYPDLPQAYFTPASMHLEPVGYFYYSESLTGFCEHHSSQNTLAHITSLDPHYRYPRGQAGARVQIRELSLDMNSSGELPGRASH